MYSNYLSGHRENLTLDMFGNLVNELATLGTKSITFTGGGEPLMSHHFLEMVRLAKLRKFEIGLITNGVLLNKITNPSEFTFIRVSLDAATGKTYKKVKGKNFFDQVIRNIESAVTAGGTVGLSFAVYDANVEEIEQATALAKELKVEYIQFKPAWINGGKYSNFTVPDEEQVIWTDRYIAKDTLPCKIASLIGIVGADGFVYFCCQYRGDPRFKLGDLSKDTFKDIWKRRLRIDPDIQECPQCRYMNYAKGYRDLLKHGDLFFKHRNFM